MCMVSVIPALHPSDYTVWPLDSPIWEKIEKTPGFLRPGLVIYGDNAYVNMMTTVSPFKGVSSGPKDAFNFYHSQELRITIEGAFGTLVHRWGCLRKPMPQFAVSKITRLVVVLCKLHNYCIDCNLSSASPTPLPEDQFNISSEGGYAMLSSNSRVNELLDAGDIIESGLIDRRRARSSALPPTHLLPIYDMLRHIETNGYQRPPSNIRSRN